MNKTLLLLLACSCAAPLVAAQSRDALTPQAENDSLAIAEQLYAQARSASTSPDAKPQLYRRAAELFSDFIRRYPRSAQRTRALYYQAMCYEALREQQSSLSLLKKLADSCADSGKRDDYAASAAYRYASLASQQKRWSEAERYYDLAIELSARPALSQDAAYRLGRAQMMQGKYAQAEKSFTGLIAQPAGLRSEIYQSALYLLSQVKVSQGEPRAAYGHLVTLLSLRDLNPKLEGPATLQAARLASQLNLPDESQRYYDRLSRMPSMGEYAGEAQLQYLTMLLRNKEYRKIAEIGRVALPEISNKEKSALRYMIIGQAYMELKDYANAAEAFRNACEDQPEGVRGADAMYRLILCTLQCSGADFLKLAAAYLQRFAVPGSETADLPCTNLVRMMYADRLMTSDVSEAARQFDAINIQRLPKSVQANAYYRKAWTAMQGSDYDPLPSLDEFVKSFPQDERMPEVLAMRGIALAGQKKADEALKDFDRVIKEYPNSAAVATCLQQAAQVCAANNRSARMKDYYQALVNLKQTVTPQALAEANYAIAGYYVKEEPAQAVPYYEEAARQDPRNYEELSRYYLVICHFRLQQYDELRQSLDELEHKFPERYKAVPAAVFRWCGWMCYQKGDHASSAKYLTGAVERSPKESYTTDKGETAERPKVDGLVWKTLARAYLELGEYQKGYEASERYLEQVTQPYPRAEGMRDAALLLVGLGRTQEARQLCADAIKLGIDGPIKSSVFLALGDSYYAEKNYREAAAHYGRTANIVSDKDLKPLSLYKIVCALKKDGKDGEALQYEENLRKEFPNWTPPERVRRMMEESSE